MRPNSQKSQNPIRSASNQSICRSSNRLAATLLTVVALLAAPTAFAGSETVEDEGRRTQTGPKGWQAAVDGMPLDEEPTSPAESGYVATKTGRRIHARPTQPVSVGLLGCPGCTWVLGAVGGVFVDVDGRRKSGEYANDGGNIRDRSTEDGKRGKRLTSRPDSARPIQTGPVAGAATKVP